MPACSPDDGPGHETERGKGQVSAGYTVVAVEGQRGRGQQRHDDFMLDINLGSGGKLQGSSSPAAAIPPSWRCTGEGGVAGRDSGDGAGVVWENLSSGRLVL